MPICVFDIAKDGTTHVPSDTHLTGAARYRWWHFDASDPMLPDWLATHLPDIPAGALMQAETRPRCDAYVDGMMLNLRGINLNTGQPADQMVSIRMWVADAVVITVRVRRVFAVEDLRQTAIAQQAPPSPSAFITALVTLLTGRIEGEVSQIEKLTEFFEADLEDDRTPPPVQLPATRRSVIRLRRYLEPQRDALAALAVFGAPLIPEPEGLVLRELANRTTIVVEELDALRERLITVQDDHDLDVARKQARHGYVLSIAAGVFLPLGFLTGLFGVNVAGLPGLEDPRAFIILCLSMVALAVATLGLLRWFRWL
ncbi:CorA family divalent cation transporter [Sulfitobacter sp. JB4-11]|uniref:CorA family divalent cation transporter n=1 Tax=Sulfitobacter rhodophyticola TaxID=3238304 RepID=UPI0035131C29